MTVVPVSWYVCFILLIRFDCVLLFSRLELNVVQRRRSSIVNDDIVFPDSQQQVNEEQSQKVVDNCVCVFHYQCDRNYVLITNGDGIIDERYKVYL